MRLPLTSNQIIFLMTTCLHSTHAVTLTHIHIKELGIWFVKYKIYNLPSKNLPTQ